MRHVIVSLYVMSYALTSPHQYLNHIGKIIGLRIDIVSIGLLPPFLGIALQIQTAVSNNTLGGRVIFKHVRDRQRQCE